MFPTWSNDELPKSATADFDWRSGGGPIPTPSLPFSRGGSHLQLARSQMRSFRFRSCLCGLLEPLQQSGPAAVDVFAHFGAGFLAHLLELAVLELDPRRVLPVGQKPHLDFGAHARVRLPLAVDVPAHHEAVRRFPHLDGSDVDARAVLAELV